MIVVDRHPIDVERCRRRAVSEAESMTRTLEAVFQDPSLLNTLYQQARTHAGYLSAAEPDSENICRSLGIAAEALAAVFSAASTEGEIASPLAGRVLRQKAPGTNSAADALTFCDAFFLAVVTRNASALDTLSTVTPEVWLRSPTQTADYAHELAGLLRVIHTGETSINVRLEAALRATDPAALSQPMADYALYLVVPVLDLFVQLLSRDAAAFNHSLEKALAAHRSYYDDPERKLDPFGFIALGPLAVAHMAEETGMAIEVTSGYLPAVVLDRS